MITVYCLVGSFSVDLFPWPAQLVYSQEMLVVRGWDNWMSWGKEGWSSRSV